jgi:hypothetical protein
MSPRRSGISAPGGMGVAVDGRRPIVRTVLHPAALRASRRYVLFGNFRQCLQAASRPAKAAIVAAARKFFIALNDRAERHAGDRHGLL